MIVVISTLMSVLWSDPNTVSSMYWHIPFFPALFSNWAVCFLNDCSTPLSNSSPSIIICCLEDDDDCVSYSSALDASRLILSNFCACLLALATGPFLLAILLVCLVCCFGEKLFVRSGCDKTPPVLKKFEEAVSGFNWCTCFLNNQSGKWIFNDLSRSNWEYKNRNIKNQNTKKKQRSNNNDGQE